MFFRRGVRHDDRLGQRIALFTIGAVLALFGMGLQIRWLIGAAALVLAAGILLRFIPRRHGEEPPREP